MGSPSPTVGPLESSAGYVQPIPIKVVDVPTAAKAIAQLYTTIAAIIRRASFIAMGDGTHASQAGDLAATYLRILSPATPDESFEVPHFLGRTPIGFDVCKVIAKPGIFYAVGEANGDGGGWNTKTIKLRCTTSNTIALIRVY